ncbi:VOC family protein [Hymenobacter sp.]|uniref:VOC family protein n=1 Tax=Hymenobacter sp. TaxID=1898978 RepID=UPI002869F668|nr:VOC family protein [Hymenobacter sp.]
MAIDHVFIFSARHGAEADELLAFGFTEGSSRTHPGQGTRNRKFYFENFFLEILWVINEQELRSDLLAPTKLWERANFQTNAHSRFGLCLLNDDSTDALFTPSVAYQPAYFPPGSAIEVLPNAEQPALPWTFRLPFKGPRQKSDEPTAHPNGLVRLTNATFGVPSLDPQNSFVRHFQNEPDIAFTASSSPDLVLLFDNHKTNRTKVFEGFPLTIKY